MVCEEHPLWARMWEFPSNAQRIFTSSTGVQSDGRRWYTISAPSESSSVTGLPRQAGIIASVCRLCASVAATMPIS